MEHAISRPNSGAAGRPSARRGPRLHLARHEVASPLIDPAHDGLRVVHLTDLHVAYGVTPRRLQAAVELTNALQPDFVLLTGDYVCASAASVFQIEDALRRLKAPAYATLGNHDHWADAPAIAAALRRAGLEVLANEARTVEVRGAPLHLVGIDDARTGRDDPDRALAGLPPRGTRLVLTHDPNAADALKGRGVALALAGHTHGGQICLPGLTGSIARTIGVKYLAGFYQVGETRLFVNRGLGASVPVRLAAPAEMALLTLRGEAASFDRTGTPK